MSRANVIDVGGQKVELFFSTWAMQKVEEISGKHVSQLGEYLDEKLGTTELMVRMSKVLAILANGAIMKRNMDITVGLADGEKKPFYPDDYFIYTANAGDFMKYQEDISNTLAMGLGYIVPDGVKLEERDLELEELEREKNPERRAAT
ncbi:MAG: hypothetical protein ACI4JK_03410 [Oscillospiraceae bacterium]